MKRKNEDCFNSLFSTIMSIAIGLWIGILLVLPYTDAPDYLFFVAALMGFICSVAVLLDVKKVER